MKKTLLTFVLIVVGVGFVTARNIVRPDSLGSVVDKVVWVVGDEAILLSEIEVTRIQAAMEGLKWQGDPDCAIPEQLAVQKLFLHQAAIDSIDKDVTESDIQAQIDVRIDYMVEQIGSREKLEEYRKQSITQIKQSLHDDLRDQLLIQKMKQKLVSDIVVTPAEVRRYFKDLSQDSIPYVPTEVEVQIIAQTPKISIEEINRVKDELREYTDRIKSGETSFQTLARLYSEDPSSRRQGGELDYTGRGVLDPAFAAVAFNLNDPKVISKVVESEFGFHIIQLIDKRGDKIKVRHILRKPVVTDSAVQQTLVRLDSIAVDIRADHVPQVLKGYYLGEHFTFEDAVSVFSDDKDTRNNRGLMANLSERGQTSRFRLQDLPPEVARVVDTLRVGQISQAFPMINNRGKTVCVIAKLKSRREGHKATITEDFQVMKELVLEKRRAKKLHDWVVDKIRSTYTRIGDEYKDCQFEYEGWNK
jgi:peptidyl-prolyl cis-trans isomerase SurA